MFSCLARQTTKDQGLRYPLHKEGRVDVSVEVVEPWCGGVERCCEGGRQSREQKKGLEFEKIGHFEELLKKSRILSGF